MTDSLKLLATPIIFVSIVATISGMRSFQEMRNLGIKVFKYTLITTLFAASVALSLYLILNPVQPHLEGVLLASDTSSPTYLDALVKMYPSNIVTAFHENNVIGVVLIAAFLGISILLIPQENKKALNHLFSSLFSALVKMTEILVKILPIGIWAFVAIFVVEMREGKQGPLDSLFKYVLCVFGANLFQGLIVLPLLLKYKGISPVKTAKGMFSAISVAFFSKSSNATLPLTMKCAEVNLKISAKVANFSLPLCTTINMNGCAAFILTTVLFVAMSSGVHFSLVDMFAWVLIATLAAIGNAGIPMGCYFLASAFLASMNVPLDMMGLILPIYTIMDMVETSLNVWSDGCVTAIVDKEFVAEDVVQTAG